MDGRKYKIFQRFGAGCCWNVHFQCRGKRYLRSLGTVLKGEAKIRATKLIRGVRAKTWEDNPAVEEPLKLSFVGDVIRTYETKGLLQSSERTVRNNVRYFRKMLRDAFQKNDADT
ncbi:MAG TPA: hypothetical protein VHH73_00720, partial [Verrucomicrobiae bacterium]|nr:hypothetical protein [Verrucomicrobiae bacterium]